MSEPAARDALTGALPRDALDRHWQQLCEQATLHGSPCSLLVFDVDHFKSINDAFGHRRGDAVLKEVVQRVQAGTRDTDGLYRYGGDEFVLVLPGSGKHEAAELAQRLLAAVREPMGADRLAVGLSIGLVSLPEDGHDPAALFERADARCYDAKRGGRGQVVAQDLAGHAELPFAQLSRRIERDAAQAQSQAFLAALQRQGRGVLRISGPAGVGRSSMLRDLAQRARLQSCLVIELPCSPRLQSRPYAALLRVLPEFAPAAGTPGEAQALEQLLRSRMAASGSAQLLCCVDDLAHLDWHTLYLLRQLMATADLPVLGLALVLDSGSAQASSLVTAPLQVELPLQALSEEGLRVWLRLLLQWDPPVDFSHWLGEQTGRLPGAVERLLRQLLERQVLRRAATGWQLRDDYARQPDLSGAAWQPAAARHNLPLQLSSFVGRERELAAIRHAVQQHRLVTLTGTGGTGKTRLALRVAGELLDDFRQGAWFVDLARVSDAEGVALAAASALGVRKVRGRPLLLSLSAWLAGKELLLVLDNCEHLLGACAELAEAALRASPGLRVLATSREALALPGEQVWHVPSLSLPALQDAAHPHDLLPFEAVRLFIERAVLAQPGFQLLAENAPAVVQICRRLDGIPLAIELAAARLRVLTPAQIAQRLDDRFALLAGGSRTALPRQQTLRALVDWSHELLSPDEQVLLRRLAVFAGGCTLEAAEAICGALRPLQPGSVLGLLTSLADKSLLAPFNGAAGPRYGMLETIRHYAQDKLQAAGEAEALHRLHLQAMLAQAEHTEPVICGPAQQQGLDQLDDDSDNLRSALAWAQAHDADAMLRLASALWRFCDLRGYRVTGLGQLLRAVQHGRGDAPHALALARAAYMARNLSDFAQAHALAGEALDLALALARSAQASQAEALALFVRGAAALELSRTEEGWGSLQAALAASRALGDEGLAASTLVFLGFEAEQRNDVATARHWMAQGLAAARRAGDRRRISHALVRLGFVAMAAGDGAQAMQHFEEALALGRSIGDKAHILNGLYLLGRAALFQGDLGRARQLLHEVTRPQDGAVPSEIAWGQLELARVCWAEGDDAGREAALQQVLALTQQGGLDELRATALVLQAHAAREAGDAARATALAADGLAIFLRCRREGLCLCAELWALLALDAGQPAQAARWLGAREALRERLFTMDHYPFLLQRRAAVVEQLHQRLGLDAFATAWRAGRALSEAELVAQAPGALSP